MYGEFKDCSRGETQGAIVFHSNQQIKFSPVVRDQLNIQYEI